MEPGAHYLAKLELIIMFHGALRKFQSITRTSAMGNEREGREGLILENRIFHERTCHLKKTQHVLIVSNF